MDRRELLLALSALSLTCFAAEAQAPAAQTPTGPPLPEHGGAFPLSSFPANKSATGSVAHKYFAGFLPTGEHVELHQTTIQPGQMPHPPHMHQHSEFMFVHAGTVEFTTEGKSTTAGPGGVLYAKSNQMHGLKNIGKTPATYFVIAIGVEPALHTT